MVRLEDVDDDPLDGEDGCTFLVGLMQKDARSQRRLDRQLQTIGFAIYEVPQSHLIFYDIRALNLAFIFEQLTNQLSEILSFLTGPR